MEAGEIEFLIVELGGAHIHVVLQMEKTLFFGAGMVSIYRKTPAMENHNYYN